MIPHPDVAIIAAARTPVTGRSRAQSHLGADQLASAVLRDLAGRKLAGLNLTGSTGEAPAAVVLGNCTGPGGNLGRIAALGAGFGTDCVGWSVDAQCGAGMVAIQQAADHVLRTGAVVAAGGAESPSTAPERILGGVAYRQAPLAPAGFEDPDMTEAADTLARLRGISRQRQEHYALRSHRLSVAHAALRVRETVPVPGAAPAGVPGDEAMRGFKDGQAHVTDNGPAGVPDDGPARVADGGAARLPHVGPVGAPDDGLSLYADDGAARVPGGSPACVCDDGPALCADDGASRVSDDGPRRLDPAVLSRFRPVVDHPGASVTPATAARISDGAAAVLLVPATTVTTTGAPAAGVRATGALEPGLPAGHPDGRRRPADDAETGAVAGAATAVPAGCVTGAETATAAGTAPCRLRAWTLTGGDPALPGLAPAAAIRAALDQAGLTLGELAAIELVEAYASQVLAVLDELGLAEPHSDGTASRIDPRVNAAGGALALGHPWGASGAVAVVRLVHRLHREAPGALGVAACAIGGGMGAAMVLERMP